MFVRDQHGGERVVLDSRGLQPGSKAPDRHTGIDQQIGVTGLDEEGVPGAPAPKADYAHSDSILRIFRRDSVIVDGPQTR